MSIGYIENPEKIPDDLNACILTDCIRSQNIEVKTSDDYIFFMTLNMLKHCCSNPQIKTIICRIILNNLVSKIKAKTINLKPNHQLQGFEILEYLRSDLVKDFTTNLQLEVTKDTKI
jgi:hypothetical protein